MLLTSKFKSTILISIKRGQRLIVPYDLIKKLKDGDASQL